MSNSSIGNYGALGTFGSVGTFGTSTTSATSTPSASVLAKVERTMAGQTGSVSKLNASLTRDQTKLSGLGQLQSALTGFQSVAGRLSGAGLSTSASSSAKGVLSVAAGGTAKAGSYAVDVQQLAQGQVLTGAPRAAADAKIGTGSPATVKIEFGTADGDSFTPGKSAAKTITIDSKNNTLDGIASSLKAAGIDASVIKSEGGYALSVKGASGAANSLRISVSGDAAVKDLLAYSPGGNGKLAQTSAAQDALATVDGKQVRSASNTLDDAIAGASLTLTGTGKTDVVVAQDSSRIAKNVGNFVAAFNDLNNQLTALQKGGLKSDPALGQVGRELAQLVAPNNGSTAALAAAGVTLDSSGKLQLDEKKLNAAIAADPDAITKLFTNDGKGLADQFDSKIDALTGNNGALRKETQAVGKEIATLGGKKAELAKALTAQANALVQLYTQQEQAASSDALPGYSGPRSLFDFLA
ncbi:MAG: flagellar filament capping protein FliD [Pseudomonadota bacterium]